MATYFLILSSITLIVWGYDKYRAVAGQWRVPEKVLLTLTVIGGAYGALAGMLLFRHKTRKPAIWITVLLACAVHGWILVKGIVPAAP